MRKFEERRQARRARAISTVGAATWREHNCVSAARGMERKGKLNPTAHPNRTSCDGPVLNLAINANMY
jgi:hypothetical protein